MDISLRWLNRCLDVPVSADEAEQLLTFAGFPFDGHEVVTLPSGERDDRFDVEVTSNRGDVLSHIGCAREIAAAAGASVARKLLEHPSPSIRRSEQRVGDAVKLINGAPELCPLFTVHVIRGVKVGPSPAWLVDLLEAVGQRSINNVVDVTNFITLELGNPCHVFDLSKLAGATLEVRHAREGEKLTTLDGKQRTLKQTDLVVADAERAQSLAGVIGGQDSEVDDSTTDVVFEMATWDPVTIRRPARRMTIRTDAGYRFERIVDPRTIPAAAEQAVAMIQELAGGDVLDGSLSEGPGATQPSPITLRTERCTKILGVELASETIAGLLQRIEVECETAADGSLSCRPPAFRPDLEREIDLIEEVARIHGYSQIPLSEKLSIRVRRPQHEENNRAKIASTLTGLGFFETVTFSFVSPEAAAPYIEPGQSSVGVDDDRRGAEPTLRPSVIPSLLKCRAANQDARVQQPGGVRLFEVSAVFSQIPKESGPGQSVEHQRLTLMMDVEGVKPGKSAAHEQLQAGLRSIRGAVEAVVEAVAQQSIEVRPAPPVTGAFDEAACGRVILHRDGKEIDLGMLGLVAPALTKQASLAVPVVAAELDMPTLLAMKTENKRIGLLPEFPAIERDLSLIVDEQHTWDSIRNQIDQLGSSLDHFESLEFVGVFRGKQVGSGKKSSTVRMRFRAPDRTLRHEEVDPQMGRVVEKLQSEIGAELRM